MRKTALFGLPHQNPPCTICIQHDRISNFKAFVMISEIYMVEDRNSDITLSGDG